MSALPIVLGLAALGGFAFLAKRQKSGVNLSPIDVTNIPGAAQPAGPPSVFRGKSGVQFLIHEIKIPAGTALDIPNQAQFDVILNDPNIPAQPHMVLRFAINRSNPNARKLVKTGESTPHLIQAARSDLAV